MSIKVEHVRKQFEKFERYVERNADKIEFDLSMVTGKDPEKLEKENEEAQAMSVLVRDIRSVANTLNGLFQERVTLLQEEELQSVMDDGEAAQLILLLRQKGDLTSILKSAAAGLLEEDVVVEEEEPMVDDDSFNV